MSRVEPHPTDKGRYQATFNEYGHGKGNGKSRSMVYKHYKKLHDSKKVDKTTKKHIKKNKDTASLSDSTKSDLPDESEDFVQIEEESDWSSIAWLEEDDDEMPKPTIPAPIRRLSSGGEGLSEAHRATQTQLIRWGYMGIDRGLTHWGRGVMSRPEWTIERHPADYDAMEAATTHMMDSQGLSIQLSPTLVWGTVLAAAYTPPIAHIAKNSDPALRRSVLRRFGKWLMKPSEWFRRRRAPPVEQPTD